METFSALLALCAGNSPIAGEFPAQRPVTRSFDVFFDLRLNKRLGKQSRDWWFETLSCPLWRHCNGISLNKCYAAGAYKTMHVSVRHVSIRSTWRKLFGDVINLIWFTVPITQTHPRHSHPLVLNSSAISRCVIWRQLTLRFTYGKRLLVVTPERPASCGQLRAIHET